MYTVKHGTAGLTLLCLNNLVVGTTPPTGTYLLRLLPIRHGYSCGNAPYGGTTNAEKLTPDGMGPALYNETIAQIDRLMRSHAPTSMEGMVSEWGMKPRGWPVPGKSKTSDGRSDDILVKARNKALADDQYNEHGNLIALHNLVKDPHLIDCYLAHCDVAREVMGEWMDREGLHFDLVASSSLMRAVETAQLVFLNNRVAARKTHDVTILPYLNERNEGTPYEPENFPYPHETQAAKIEDLLGFAPALQSRLTEGEGAYPRMDQQYDKFKVVLALEVLPRLVERASRKDKRQLVRRSYVYKWHENATASDSWKHSRAWENVMEVDHYPLTWEPNEELRAALESGRGDGHPKIPVRSSWEQVRDDPLEKVVAGALEYVHGESFDPEKYDFLRRNGAQEFVIGIGSHGNFMKDYCLHGAAAPPNNLAVFEKRLIVNVSSFWGATTFRVSEDSGPCRQIMETPPPPEPGTLSWSDLGAACSTPFDVTHFMDLRPESDGRSSCMSRASRESFQIVDDPERAPPREPLAIHV